MLVEERLEGCPQLQGLPTTVPFVLGAGGAENFQPSAPRLPVLDLRDFRLVSSSSGLVRWWGEVGPPRRLSTLWDLSRAGPNALQARGFPSRWVQGIALPVLWAGYFVGSKDLEFLAKSR
jgi:hypothetical protein